MKNKTNEKGKDTYPFANPPNVKVDNGSNQPIKKIKEETSTDKKKKK